MSMNLKEINAKYVSYIENYLKQWFERFDNEPQKSLFEAMKYSLLAGGKRLRPILCMEFCRLCCGDWQKAAPFAAAVEMIHTYSLIHDDLPAMDNDDYRRGRLTNHKVYGEAMAILAGDALLTDAFAVASTADLQGTKMGEAISVLAECAGSTGMVGGQVLDIQSEERLLTDQEVLDIQTRKTGALICGAACTGALVGGASDAQFEAAGIFASCLGLAFQIRDDMLDVIGDAKELGKAVGVDENKNTFVRLYGLEKCDELIQLYTEKAIEALSVFEDTEYLVALAKSLTDRTI